jgi:hypothetical protein
MIAKKHKKEIFDGGNRKQMRLTLRGAREKTHRGTRGAWSAFFY